MIDLRHLRYFLAVAAERNFTRAADRLHMAQPPLSRQIQQLEAELGMALFDRDSRPLALTPAGQIFHEQAQLVTQRMDDLRLMMRRLRSSEKVRFTVGFVPSVIYGRLPSVLRDFRTALPNIDLRLVEMMSVEQIGALKNGEIDIGVGRIRFDEPALRREVLLEEPLVAALPQGHPALAQDGPLDLAELARDPVIIYPRELRPSYADQVLALFHDHALYPTSHEVRELQTAIGLVAAEAGICIVPQSVQRLERRDVAYRPLRQKATSPIIINYRKDEASPLVQTFRKVMQANYQT
ncbi:LysR family transcriptional regulator [Niveispirillum sp. SYP-B3756]|uniref:LysR family transcriptional regulator n=1 Tax=Niveispirillum sp. SYP-B3756 TaxID=2662178 RepID=UPI0012929438|nr:LysR family transcriptional regulator [Niveispirillum sp. SYP-B3756]